MKTAEEILDSYIQEQNEYLDSDQKSVAVDAMKFYANQKLDEAETNAKVIHVEQDGDPISDPTDQLSVFGIKNYEVPTYVIIDCNSIRNLKDEL